MSDMKMSEHFEFGLCLEVRCGHIHNRYDEFTDKQAGIIEDAINNHDRMVEEIGELRGALSSLNVATLNGCADYRETNLSRYVNKLLNKND